MTCCRMDNEWNAVFSALSDSLRRNILVLLLERDMTVSEIAVRFPITLAGVSKHLRILANAGLVTRKKTGRETWYGLNPDGLKPVFDWMQQFGFMHKETLDLLEKLLDHDDAL